MTDPARERWTRHHSCPVCEGHGALPRGQGTRCHGYRLHRSDGSPLVYCARVESDKQHGGELWRHFEDADCPCGTPHGPERFGQERTRGGRNRHAEWEDLEPEEAYVYQNERGEPHMRVVRFRTPDGSKTFKQYRPDGMGGWLLGLGDVEPILYRLPKVREALDSEVEETVWILEGEKDVDTLVDLGEYATTNPMGAGSWHDRYSEVFRGAKVGLVRIIPDRDEPGEKHADEVRRSLKKVGFQAQIWRTHPGCKDVTEHLEAGYGLDELRHEAPAFDGFHAPTLTEETLSIDNIPEPLIDGLIYQAAFTNVVGPPKVGKTVLCMQAAMCLVAGVPFLGLNTRKARVGYVLLETMAALFRDRAQSIAHHTGVPLLRIGESFQLIAPTAAHGAPLVDLTREGAREGLAYWIREHGLEVVFLDTMLHVAPGISASDDERMGDIFRNVGHLSQDTGCAIVAIDYVPRSREQASDNVSHVAIGTVAKGALANVIAQVSKDGATWKLASAGHYGDLEGVHYRAPEQSGAFGCLVTTPTEAKGKTRMDVYDLYKTHSEPLDNGHPGFRSKNALIEAIKQAGWTRNSTEADALAQDVLHHHAEWDGHPPTGERQPVRKARGPRRAIVSWWVNLSEEQ